MDAGPLALAVVGEELGRCLAPVPFLSSAVLATAAFTLAADRRIARHWLPRLAGGAVGTVALTGEAGHPADLDVRARADGDGLVLSGVAGSVPDVDVAEVLIVAAQGPEGVILAVITPEQARHHRILVRDRTRSLGRVELADVRVPPDQVLAEGDAAGRMLADLYRRAGAALAADAAGGGRRIHEMAVRYAKDRVQFDRPIGSFQAVKHKMADTYVLVEAASAAAEGAARAVANGDHQLAALTTAYALEAYTDIAGDAIQVHGGIGYTWEHDCHLVFKRAQLNEALLGSAAWHREQAARLLLAAG